MDASLSSTKSPSDNNGGYGAGFECTPRLGRYIQNPNPVDMPSRVLYANKMLNYANRFRLRDGVRRSDSRKFITMLSRMAIELLRLPVATPTVTCSATSLDT